MSNCIAKGCTEDTTAMLCHRCQHRLERNLAETPSLVDTARRHFLAAGQQGSSDGSRHTKGNPPLPLAVHVHDALVHLELILGSWTAMVCEERDLRGPDHRNDVDATSRWLLAQLDWCAQQPWADDLELEIRDALRVLRAVLGLTVPMVTLALSCPYCGEQSLRARKDASSDVTCSTDGCQDERGERPTWTRHTWALLLSEAS